MIIIATEFVVRTKISASEKVQDILNKNNVIIVEKREVYGNSVFSCRATKDGYEAVLAEFENGKIPVMISAD